MDPIDYMEQNHDSVTEDSLFFCPECPEDTNLLDKLVSARLCYRHRTSALGTADPDAGFPGDWYPQAAEGGVDGARFCDVIHRAHRS